MNAGKPANYTNVKAQELWKTLYLCAKENPRRRFHALYDKIYRADILAEAWRRVKGKKGVEESMDKRLKTSSRNMEKESFSMKSI